MSGIENNSFNFFKHTKQEGNIVLAKLFHLQFLTVSYILRDFEIVLIIFETISVCFPFHLYACDKSFVAVVTR